MKNIDDLRVCMEDQDEIASWLIDFVYETTGEIISDAQVLHYLSSDCIIYDNKDG